nr:MAG TPA: zonular occludens toxin [Inoviridae sp.]
MITCVNGIPGSGKNVLVTKICLHHYKKTNNSIRRLIRKIKKEPIWINNIYSTYPILLKKTKKEKIYSNIVTIYDLVPSNRFLNHAVIVIDETQAFYDSEDHKEFPKEIAIFNQFHRHFGIDDIYYVSQHPSRIMKKLRILACEFDKIKRFICIPFIHLAFMHIVRYFEFDDYGKYNHPKKEAKTYDVKNKYMLFFAGKVFKAYDSKYLKVLNIDKPLYNRGMFRKLDLSEKEIKYIYRDNL